MEWHVIAEWSGAREGLFVTADSYAEAWKSAEKLMSKGYDPGGKIVSIRKYEPQMIVFRCS